MTKSTHQTTRKLTRNGLMGPSPDENAMSAKLSKMGMFCLSGIGDHGHVICIDADLRVYGCLSLDQSSVSDISLEQGS